MKENRALYLNIILHSFLLFILSTIQSSLWYKIFYAFPPPFFWIHFLVYISIYRTFKDSFSLALIGFLVLTSFTLVPHGLIFLIGFLIILFCIYMKDRIFWPGPSYYLVMSGVSGLMYVILYYLLVYIFEETNAPDFRFLYLFLQIALTTLTAPIFYFVYQSIDYLTGKEQSIPMEEIL